MTPGLGRFPGKGNGNPHQYSCLENPTDQGAWQATVHGAARVGHDLATKLPPLPRVSRCQGLKCKSDWGTVPVSTEFANSGNKQKTTAEKQQKGKVRPSFKCQVAYENSVSE